MCLLCLQLNEIMNSSWNLMKWKAIAACCTCKHLVCDLPKQFVSWILFLISITHVYDLAISHSGLNMLFGVIVCTTLNMDQRKQKRELCEEIRNKLIDNYGKGYKPIFNQLDVSVTAVANVIKKFNVYGTVANLPERGCKRKIDPRLNRRIAWRTGKEPRMTAKEIQAEIQGEGMLVSRCTIRRFFCESGLHRDPVLLNF